MRNKLLTVGVAAVTIAMAMGIWAVSKDVLTGQGVIRRLVSVLETADLDTLLSRPELGMAIRVKREIHTRGITELRRRVMIFETAKQTGEQLFEQVKDAAFEAGKEALGQLPAKERNRLINESKNEFILSNGIRQLSEHRELFEDRTWVGNEKRLMAMARILGEELLDEAERGQIKGKKLDSPMVTASPELSAIAQKILVLGGNKLRQLSDEIFEKGREAFNALDRRTRDRISYEKVSRFIFTEGLKKVDANLLADLAKGGPVTPDVLMDDERENGQIVLATATRSRRRCLPSAMPGTSSAR